MGRLDITGLTKIFEDESGNIVAVDDLDITVEDGEFLILVGPSGCGKSTTLRCIAGLERPTSGELLLDGENIVDKKPKNRDMAMVFQNYALYPHMSARDNMSFGLRMGTDMAKGDIDRIVEETAEMMGIEDLLDDKPSEISGGQQQRVALGRAIVRQPEVFLMDEPLSNLDAKLRSQMRTELNDLQQELGTTTIYVTHDQTEAMTMGDRIAILDGGELQQIGTPLECYNEPTNRFVAGFIGSPGMNFLSVERTDSSLEHSEFDYAVSSDIVGGLESPGRRLVLGIRPEDIRLADGDERNAISLPVSVVEPMGDLTHFYLELGDEQITATVDGATHVTSGEVVDIVFPEDRIHLFDEQTGEAIKNRETSLEETGSDPATSFG